MPTRRVIGRRCPQGRRVARAPSGCAWALALVAALGPQPASRSTGPTTASRALCPRARAMGAPDDQPALVDGGRHGGGGGATGSFRPSSWCCGVGGHQPHALPGATPEGPGAERSPVDQDLLERLRREGPQFAPQYNMSAFAARGIVQGGWPLVFDFEQRSKGRSGSASVPRACPRSSRSPGAQAARSVPRRDVGTQEIGAEPRPALIAVTATEMDGQTTLPGFKVYGLGAGARAWARWPSITSSSSPRASARERVRPPPIGSSRTRTSVTPRSSSCESLEPPTGVASSTSTTSSSRPGAQGPVDRRPRAAEWNGTDGDNRVSPGPTSSGSGRGTMRATG